MGALRHSVLFIIQIGHLILDPRSFPQHWELSFQHHKITAFSSVRYISSSRIPGLYGNSTFNFLRNCHISISSCTVLHSHQHCTGSDFQYPCQHFFFLFFVVPILIAMEWYLLVVLISIFLMISGLNIFSCAYWPLLYLL